MDLSIRRHKQAAAGVLLGVLLLFAGLIVPAQAQEPQIQDVKVTFHVQNVNRSKLPCGADGSEVTLSGRMVGPASVLANRDAHAPVTLYFHEFSFGKWFWHFPDPAYDYAAQMADQGHVSILVDRLGYGDSTHPNGFQTCLGADADEIHQIVTQVRAGTYQTDSGTPRSYDHVVLAGHSGGAMASEISAYSFGGVDGLMVFAHANQQPSAHGIAEGLIQGANCLFGGQPAGPGLPGGYAYFGQSDTDWQKDYFYGAEPRIVAAATPLRHRDPCGDVFSFAAGLLPNASNLHLIKVPVLLLYGLDDALYDQPAAGQTEKGLFGANPDVTLKYFPGSGHALNLQRTAPDVRATVSTWLTARGLG
ncbi:alpha/beta hydrolase [Streptomyces sp. B1866]|uniref:alpha/beta hydrolase n=1 Tax=Streptomyces sp. B1866 TaxID=3075431 RepID=UPI00288F9D59|nr:alpha/beta hydrolase [Streptomyces sp. B1866]MDT3396203.1 alpha/beta hydrolase [Streptomyces sp. B1866]